MRVHRAAEAMTRNAERQWLMDAEVPGAEHVEVRLEDLFVDDVERLRQAEEALAMRHRRRPWVTLGIAVGLGLIVLAIGAIGLRRAHA